MHSVALLRRRSYATCIVQRGVDWARSIHLCFLLFLRTLACSERKQSVMNDRKRNFNRSRDLITTARLSLCPHPARSLTQLADSWITYSGLALHYNLRSRSHAIEGHMETSGKKRGGNVGPRERNGFLEAYFIGRKCLSKDICRPLATGGSKLGPEIHTCTDFRGETLSGIYVECSVQTLSNDCI